MEQDRREEGETRIFFGDIETQEEAAGRYRTLAMQWHPDRTSDPDATIIMAMINTEYRECLRCLAAGTWVHPVRKPPPKRAARQPAPRVAATRKRSSSRKVVSHDKRDVSRLIDKAADLTLDAARVVISAATRSMKRRIGDSP